MNLRRLAGIAFAAILLAACGNPAGLLDLSIAIDSGGVAPPERSIVPTADTQIASLLVTGTSGAGSFSFTAPADATSVTRDGLGDGEWTITVDAWNAAAAVIFTGTDTVTVEGGPAAAAVVLRPPPGDGTLTLRLSWAGTTVGPQDTVQVESRLQDPGSALDPDVLGFNVAPGARRADYTGAWPAGYYLLTMVMYVNGAPAWGNAYALQIRAAAVTNEVITLTQADLRL